MVTYTQIKINGISFVVDSKLSILQACEYANIDIPRFCFHEQLSVAGNCRMCLVEVEKAPKLVASCAMPLVPGMHILTNTAAVRKAREGVLEFLLINHPLDCPICDQGGKCDLQDQAMVYGSDLGRFREYKRAVEDKNCGPFIKMIMTRCIHCTRCVRFANEIAGVPSFGTSGRGQTIEIGMYIEKLFRSEFSGNVIDLCPVGALTSKSFMLSRRSWESVLIESIDITDAIGSKIQIRKDKDNLYDVGYIKEIIPGLKEEWISDRTRFSFDGIDEERSGYDLCSAWYYLFRVDNQRLRSLPVLRKGNLRSEFPCLFDFSQLRKFVGFVGNQCDFYTVYVLKLLLHRSNFCEGNFQVSKFTNFELSKLDFSCFFLFNSKIFNLDKVDACLLVGVNPKAEGPLLNYQLRKRCIAGKIKVSLIGSSLDLGFPVSQVGLNSFEFLQIVEGKHAFCESLRKARNPIIVFGSSFFSTIGELESYQLLNVCVENTNIVESKWFGLNFFSIEASEVNRRHLGLSGLRNSSLAGLPTSYSYSIGDELELDSFDEFEYTFEEKIATTWKALCFLEENATNDNYALIKSRLRKFSFERLKSFELQNFLIFCSDHDEFLQQLYRLYFVENKKSFMFDQGHQCKPNLTIIDTKRVYLKAIPYVETSGQFLNFEGKSQWAMEGSHTASNHAFLSTLNDIYLIKYRFFSCSKFKKAASFFGFDEENEIFQVYDTNIKELRSCFVKVAHGIKFKVRLRNNFLISGLHDNGYLTDSISKASLNMKKASIKFFKKSPFSFF